MGENKKLKVWTKSSNEQFEIRYYYTILTLKVQNAIHLQSLWEKIPAANIPLKVDSHIWQPNVANEL